LLLSLIIMNSAAVIGRQLRQQQNIGRTSGPLVPPQPFKGRPRTPSHIPGLQAGRPYSPAPPSLTNLGPDADKRFAQFAQHSHEFYPHPAHRENADKEKGDKDKKDDEPRLRCTWHCFCIALKALSGGIVLLVLGTIMSVVGFLAEPLAVDYIKLDNGTVVPTIDPDTKQHLHNLTYVGPVVMGLGGIVIVAACVLTFEVRDTLGVKVAPVRPETTATLGGTANTITTTPANRKLSSIRSDSIKGKGRATAGSLTLPLATISDVSHPLSTTSKSGRIHETIQETMFNEGEPILGYTAPKPSKTIGGNGGYHQQQVSKHRTRYSIADQCITSPSSGTSHLLSPNIETTYFGLPSPQETELSDPEGCSLVVPSKWRSSRCSCSGSPTHSMSLELYLEDNDPPITVAIVEHQEYLLQQRHNQHYKQQNRPQPQPRRPKILASMESDGLSSSASSSSSDDMFVSQKTHQYCRNYVNVHSSYVDHSSYDQSDVTTPLLLNSTLSTSLVSATSGPVTAGSTAISTTVSIDKRFPLLRQGALGNGSVPPNSR
jgi:hypothetical protein